MRKINRKLKTVKCKVLNKFIFSEFRSNKRKITKFLEIKSATIFFTNSMIIFFVSVPAKFRT